MAPKMVLLIMNQSGMYQLARLKRHPLMRSGWVFSISICTYIRKSVKPLPLAVCGVVENSEAVGKKRGVFNRSERHTSGYL